MEIDFEDFELQEALRLSQMETDTSVDLELFTAIRASELLYNNQQYGQEQRDLNFSLKKSNAIVHNEKQSITILLDTHWEIFTHSIIKKCKHCAHLNVNCVHISSHDFVFFSKISRTCTSWMGFVSRWLKTKSKNLELLAFTPTPNLPEMRQLKMKKGPDFHKISASTPVGCRGFLMWKRGSGFSKKKTGEESLHGRCSCCDVRWRSLCEKLSKTYGIKVERHKKTSYIHDFSTADSMISGTVKNPTIVFTDTYNLIDEEEMCQLYENFRKFIPYILAKREGTLEISPDLDCVILNYTPLCV